jgi:predicted nucleic acid-binding protein
VIILVADTSVLIDLERGNLLQCALAGRDTIATPACRAFRGYFPSGK